MAPRIKASDPHVIATYHRLRSAIRAAEELGISPLTVYAVLKRNGVEPKYKWAHRLLPNEKIVHSYRCLGSGGRVAKELGISEALVYRVLASEGISTTGLDEYRKRIRKFKGADLKRLVREYERGASAIDLAKKYECSSAAVLSALRNSNVEIRDSKPHLTDDEKAAALALYQSGIPFKAVGAKLGRSEATIIRFIHDEHPECVRARHKVGAESVRWKGGRLVHKGYVYLRERGKYVLEHRKVMAEMLDRPLRDTETVHHINGDKTDNRPENLQLRQGKHGKHVAMICLDCGSHNIGPSPIGDD